MKIRLLLPAAILAAVTQAPLAFPSCARTAAAAESPQAALDRLLAADRVFAAAAARTDVASALAAMFDETVIMPLPNATFAHGRAEAEAALRANPANRTGRADWAPVRGGLSADAQHGFTLGYMTMRQPDGSVRNAKYLAYWVRRPAGWRVALYRRAVRPEGAVPTAMMAPALPHRLVPPSRSARSLQRHTASLDAAERAFSNEAQRIGVGPAFRRSGLPDSTNMGREAAFIVGAEAIGGADATPAQISWAPENVLVASSGDLGVTWGWIRPNGPPPEGQPAQVPYFTIWRRAAPGLPWRYIAE